MITSTRARAIAAGVAGLSIVCAGAPTRAQGRGGAEWSTAGGDAQRTSWIRADPRISVQAMQKGPKDSDRSSSCGS